MLLAAWGAVMLREDRNPPRGAFGRYGWASKRWGEGGGGGARTAMHDAACVQVLQARRHLAGDVQHFGHVRPIVLRALAAAQEPAVHSRLCTYAISRHTTCMFASLRAHMSG